MKIRQALVVAAALVTSACDSMAGQVGKDHFPVSQDLAISRLQEEHRVINGTGLGSLTLYSDGRDEKGITIAVERAGSPRPINCAVLIEMVSDQEVTSQTDCARSEAPTNAAQKKARRMIAVIVREHVRATIENAPYDIDKVSSMMIGMIAL
jgi:hypothetical protein